MKDSMDILVISEQTDDKSPTRLTLELLGLGRRLAAENNGRVGAVVLGEGADIASRELAERGADLVYFLDNPALSRYNPEVWATLLESLLRRNPASLMLAGHTSLGQDLLPRLAFSLGAGLVTDCVEIRWDGSFLFTKPVYGGNAVAGIKVLTPLALATVRARVGEALPPSSPGGELIPIDQDPPQETRLTVKDRHYLEAGECPLEEARVVVSGGRGMGGEEGFEVLRELARLLGGAVGASRPPVDAGWVPSTCQVGITGKVVAPALYVAVAISGSSQHLSGMGDSGKIVAINKDPEAYIFKVSDYGVVGDWREVLPAFLSKLRELASA